MKTSKRLKAGKTKIEPLGSTTVQSGKKNKWGPNRADPPTSVPTPTPITQDMIARRAYDIWCSKGSIPGQDDMNWEQAEMELRLEQTSWT